MFLTLLRVSELSGSECEKYFLRASRNTSVRAHSLRGKAIKLVFLIAPLHGYVDVSRQVDCKHQRALVECNSPNDKARLHAEDCIDEPDVNNNYPTKSGGHVGA